MEGCMAKEGLSDERYRELFAERERLRLSYEELAARAGVKASTLRWKKSALKRAARSENANVESTVPTLLPVRIRAGAVARAVVVEEVAPSPYEVRLVSGRILRVPRGFEAREVHALVCALEAVPC
jgi:transcriptional regulator with XRE-family HTH domain